ncbi:protein E6-like [Forsythia ovata]|uniref:Protein E6-like n=1 Tax=Forsythia ovata TaxID=205694 RepID=A0ABD1R6N0_9LAMI
MASSATNFFLLLLLALSSAVHTHARDRQFFNKIPSATTPTTTNVVKITQSPNTKKEEPNNQQQDPSFNSENENVYGLYGHESGQHPPSTTTAAADKIPTTNGEPTTNKYRPKNYNPVAYVTEPEDSTTFTEKSYTNDPNNYGGGNFNEQPQGLSETRSIGGENPNHREDHYRNDGGNYYNSQQEDNIRGNRRNNYYNNGDGNFNDQPQRLSDTRFIGGAAPNHRENYYRNGGDLNNFQRQGMSDTRFLENGKYFYDINSEKYSSNHPYESLGGIRARNEYRNRNYYGNNENSYEYNNSKEEFQNQDDFQESPDDEEIP